jgi:hypothetical protein
MGLCSVFICQCDLATSPSTYQTWTTFPLPMILNHFSAHPRIGRGMRLDLKE